MASSSRQQLQLHHAWITSAFRLSFFLCGAVACACAGAWLQMRRIDTLEQLVALQGASIAELTATTDASADWSADSTKTGSNSGGGPPAASEHDDVADDWSQAPFQKTHIPQRAATCHDRAAGAATRPTAGAATAEPAATDTAATAAQLVEMQQTLAALNATVSVLHRRMDGYRCTIDADGVQDAASYDQHTQASLDHISGLLSQMLGGR